MVHGSRLGLLEADEVETGSQYGRTLALSADHAIVGAPGSNARAGAVHEFNFQ